jgi:hypothetical protein
MDDDLNLPTTKSEAEWLRTAVKSAGTTSFFIADRTAYPDGKVAIPPYMLERLPHEFPGEAALVLTTIEAIDAIGLPIARHRQQFLRGEVVMVAPRVVAELPGRPQGGQTVIGQEERARNGVYVVIVLGTEIIRACRDGIRNAKGNLEERRFAITSLMEPFLADLSGMNCFREGQQLLTHWYPGRRSMAVMREAYTRTLNAPKAKGRAVHFAAVEDDQMQLIKTAGAIYAKALAYQNAQHEMSVEMREAAISMEMQQSDVREPSQMKISAGVLQDLTHARHDGPPLDHLMKAAVAMDFNPALVFANVTSFGTEFSCGMLLGRVSRGNKVLFEPKHLERLQRLMVQADAADREPDRLNETDKAAQHLRGVALRLKSASAWESFFIVAKASNQAVWIAPASSWSRF